MGLAVNFQNVSISYYRISKVFYAKNEIVL